MYAYMTYGYTSRAITCMCHRGHCFIDHCCIDHLQTCANISKTTIVESLLCTRKQVHTSQAIPSPNRYKKYLTFDFSSMSFSFLESIPCSTGLTSLDGNCFMSFGKISTHSNIPHPKSVSKRIWSRYIYNIR